MYLITGVIMGLVAVSLGFDTALKLIAFSVVIGFFSEIID